MKREVKIVLWVTGTILVAILGQVGVDLGNPDAPIRLIVAHALVATATSIGALLVKLPKKEWTEEERAAKTEKESE